MNKPYIVRLLKWSNLIGSRLDLSDKFMLKRWKNEHVDKLISIIMSLEDGQKKKLFMSLLAILLVATVVSLSAYMMRADPNEKKSTSLASKASESESSPVVVAAGSDEARKSQESSEPSKNGSTTTVDNKPEPSDDKPANANSSVKEDGPVVEEPTVKPEAEVRVSMISKALSKSIRTKLGLHPRYYGHILLGGFADGKVRKLLCAVKKGDSYEKLLQKLENVKDKDEFDAVLNEMKLDLIPGKGDGDISISHSKLPKRVNADDLLSKLQSKGLSGTFIEMRHNLKAKTRIGDVYVLIEGPEAEVRKIEEVAEVNKVVKVEKVAEKA